MSSELFAASSVASSASCATQARKPENYFEGKQTTGSKVLEYLRQCTPQEFEAVCHNAGAIHNHAGCQTLSASLHQALEQARQNQPNKLPEHVTKSLSELVGSRDPTPVSIALASSVLELASKRGKAVGDYILTGEVYALLAAHAADDTRAFQEHMKHARAALDKAGADVPSEWQMLEAVLCCTTVEDAKMAAGPYANDPQFVPWLVRKTWDKQAATQSGDEVLDAEALLMESFHTFGGNKGSSQVANELEAKLEALLAATPAADASADNGSDGEPLPVSLLCSQLQFRIAELQGTELAPDPCWGRLSCQRDLFVALVIGLQLLRAEAAQAQTAAQQAKLLKATGTEVETETDLEEQAAESIQRLHGLSLFSPFPLQDVPCGFFPLQFLAHLYAARLSASSDSAETLQEVVAQLVEQQHLWPQPNKLQHQCWKIGYPGLAAHHQRVASDLAGVLATYASKAGQAHVDKDANAQQLRKLHAWLLKQGKAKKRVAVQLPKGPPSWLK